jgi:O-antigen/teichoic acid export membrane protein
LLEIVGGRLRRLARDDLIRHGALVLVSQTAVNVLSFVFHALVSRRIGVEAYGSLNALLAGFTVLTVPTLVLTTIVVKYAAEFRAVGDVARLRALTRYVATSLGTVALGVMVIGAALSPAIGAYLRIGDLAAVILAVVILALNVVLPVLRGVFQGVEDFRAFSISAVLETVVKVALAFVFTGFGWGVEGALGAWAAGTAVSLLWTGAALWTRYRGAPKAELSLDFVRLARTSGGVTIAMLSVTSLGFSDVVIVKHVFSDQQAGLYSAMSLAGKMLFWLVAFVPTVVLPRAVNLTTAVLAVLTSVGLGVFSVAPAFVIGTLTGTAYVAVAPLLFTYGVASTLLAVLNTVVLYKIGIHRFGFIAPLAIVALAELVAIGIFHDAVIEVLRILIVADATALFVTLIATPERRAAP